jgi:hypothetical protein
MENNDLNTSIGSVNTGLGKRVIDLSNIVDVFEAQEGEVQQIIGKTGNGKTYEATRRALEYLKQGYTVYTTWHLILPEYYDERENRLIVMWKTLFFRKHFFRFNFRKNWIFLDIDRPDLIEFVASLTDCIVMLDEGQDIFDSRERADKTSRKTITRTRHMHKTLIVISQRAQAVDVTARANVTYFYKCVKGYAWFFPFKPYFRVYRTEEMDNQNYPVWEDIQAEWTAPLWHSGFAYQEVYDSYNSWYLRAGIPKSQELDYEAYELTFMEKIKLLFTSGKRYQPAEYDKVALKELEKRNMEKYIEATTYIDKKTGRALTTKKSDIIDKLWEDKKLVTVNVEDLPDED